MRTKQGKFTIEDSYTIDDIKNDNYKFINIEEVLDYKKIELTEDEYNKVLNGSKIKLDTNEDKIILKYQNEIIAIYQKDIDIYKPYVMLKTN